MMVAFLYIKAMQNNRSKCVFQAGEREGDRGLLNDTLNRDVNTAFKQPALTPGQLLVGK